MSNVRLDYIKTQLKHPLPTIRYGAVRSLVEDFTPEVLPLLREVARTDVSEGVRSAAIEMLAEFGAGEVASV